MDGKQITPDSEKAEWEAKVEELEDGLGKAWRLVTDTVAEMVHCGFERIKNEDISLTERHEAREWVWRVVRLAREFGASMASLYEPKNAKDGGSDERLSDENA